jgi:hypothetical protein
VLSWSAAASFAAAVIFTVIVNVPVSLATGHRDAQSPPADRAETRTRRDFFQGARSWLLLLGFVLACAAAAA